VGVVSVGAGCAEQSDWVEAAETPAVRDARATLNSAMDRYATGDEAAFSEVYDLLAPRLYAFFLRQTKNATRAEDLVQQTLLQMHCARDIYVTGADVVPWAFAIGRRLLIDGYRRGWREVLGAEDLGQDRISSEPRPDEMVEAKQVAASMARVLASLPDAQRTAFELLKHDGLSLKEAAEVLGTTVNAVKLRAHRTYEALRAALDPGEHKS
jgi:RNA polymerase sigma-70 factor, ECF subfamily